MHSVIKYNEICYSKLVYQTALWDKVGGFMEYCTECSKKVRHTIKIYTKLSPGWDWALCQECYDKENPEEAKLRKQILKKHEEIQKK